MMLRRYKIVKIRTAAVLLLLSLALPGCYAHTSQPTPPCKPLLTEMTSFVITDIATDKTFLQETEVGSGYGKLPPLKQLADLIADNSEKELKKALPLVRVSRGNDCADHAARLDMKLLAIKHKNGRYTFITNVKVTSCGTGKVLAEFDAENSDSDLFDLCRDLAKKIAKSIQKLNTDC